MGRIDKVIETIYIQIFLTAVTAVITGFIGRLFVKLDKKEKKRQQEEDEQEEFKKAMQEGLQAILRDRIMQMSSHCMEQGHTQIFMVENMSHMFSSYKNLGGNGAVKHIYEQFMDLPVVQPQQKNQRKEQTQESQNNENQ